MLIVMIYLERQQMLTTARDRIRVFTWLCTNYGDVHGNDVVRQLSRLTATHVLLLSGIIA